METLRLISRPPVEDRIENWDDDDFNLDHDDLAFPSRSVSSAANPPTRRDSYSSHLSFRSDLDSIHAEEERHVHIPGDDEKSTLEAIAAAAKAGIPIPKNVPSSALLGGTIKRLGGGKKIKKIIQDDWETDLELPDPGQALRLKAQDQARFPDVLRHVSGPVPASPTRGLLRSPPTIVPTARPDQDEPSPSALSGRINLDRFRDTDEDDDWFGDGGDTIKVSKSRRPVSLITAPTPHLEEEKEEPDEAGGGAGQEEDDKGEGQEEPDDEGGEEGGGPARGDDDFENDFELPPGGKLNLAARRDAPKTPSSQQEDFDWGEGSLGTRHAGTRRSGRSNRSSSASALSPSLSSTITFESEDETFDDLVLPNGPVDFKERLNRRKITDSPDRIPDDLESDSPKKAPTAEADRDDFLEHLDLGEGEIFDCKKLTNHRNLKLKDTRPPSPMRPKTAVTLTFTNKPVTQSRLPRPNHDRTQPSLEPVLESGGSTLKRARRPQSRLGGGGGAGGGHSAQSSISSTGVPTPSTPSPVQSIPPSTPRRKDGGAAEPSGNGLRNGPTTTNAQLLRLKRSLPAMRPPNSPAKAMSSIASRFDRPPSRGDRPQASSIRPRTPVDRRVAAETSTAAAAAATATALQTRKSHHALVPSCPSHNQPHLGPAKTRTLRRQDSEHSIELRPRSRTVSRSTTRSPSPRRLPHQPQQQQQKNDDLWARLSRPKKPKQLFDGHELDGFDDLPTSMQAESKFMKAALNAGGVKSPMRTRSKQLLPNSTTSPGPYTPMRSETLPHFARDTATSRIAREQSLISLAQRAPLQTTQAPIGPLNPHHRAPPRGHHHNHSNSQSTIRPRLRKPHEPAKKPSLISNLNMSKGPKTVNGMSYNPATFRWEGNENALNVFDAPAPSPMAPPATPLVREKETTTPRPALITNRTAVKGVQVVGGMVFDPQNMCWLKLDPKQQQQQQDKPPAASTATTATTFDSHDEDDVFKDIPDLEDKPASSTDGGGGGGACSRASDVKDDWLVGEEFDVGPEFIRRQREEEKKWRRKCGGWVGRERDRDAWRWTIRELVTQ